MGDHDVVQERITTDADGDDTVNERLSAGGPGPEGQEDTVAERLSGSQPQEAEEPDGSDAPAEHEPKARKRPAKKS